MITQNARVRPKTGPPTALIHEAVQRMWLKGKGRGPAR